MVKPNVQVSDKKTQNQFEFLNETFNVPSISQPLNVSKPADGSFTETEIKNAIALFQMTQSLK